MGPRRLITAILTACLVACTTVPDSGVRTVSTASCSPAGNVALEWEGLALKWEGRANQERTRRKQCESTCQAKADNEWWTGLKYGALITGGIVVLGGSLTLLVLDRVGSL